MINSHIIKKTVLLLLFLLPATATATLGAEGKKLVGGLSPEAALLAGEKLFRTGILPSGKPVEAIVSGDMEINGQQSPCSSCHLRSGLGSFEGGVLTTPTNGAKLFAPLSTMLDIPGPYMNRGMFKYQRPAYTDKTLAAALLEGVGPTGRTLSETMPRYFMTGDETEILIYYLKNLCSTWSPGVNEEEIRFATIVSEGVSPQDRDAMIKPMESSFRNDWNSRLELLQRQWNARWLGGKESTGLRYRKVVLDVWELKGPPSEWRKQLEDYYERKPVFALLGGMVQGKWDPVHSFCEDNKIPCILPLTDLPVVSGSDWYSLYFSKGYYLEGEAAAKYLSRVVALNQDAKILQIYRETAEGTALAKGFTDSWKKLGNAPLKDKILPASQKTGPAFWKELAAQNPGSVMLIWLPREDLANVESVLEPKKRPSTVFVSATFLSGAVQSIPDSMRDFTLITYPKRLPGEEKYSESVFNSWMKVKNIPVTNPEVSSKAYFLSRILISALVSMGTDFYRDFFMDILDCGKDQNVASVSFPMLTFGPGQRYSSKGCFVVSLTKGDNPKVLPQSEWVIY